MKFYIHNIYRVQDRSMLNSCTNVFHRRIWLVSKVSKWSRWQVNQMYFGKIEERFPPRKYLQGKCTKKVVATFESMFQSVECHTFWMLILSVVHFWLEFYRDFAYCILSRSLQYIAIFPMMEIWQKISDLVLHENWPALLKIIVHSLSYIIQK